MQLLVELMQLRIESLSFSLKDKVESKIKAPVSKILRISALSCYLTRGFFMTDMNISAGEIRFAEMLTTKFCHDIAGPVGAVNNGVEFLADNDPEMQNQAVKLIANSSSEAMVRMQFFRQAYGVNTSDSSVSINETRKIAVDYFEQAKPTLHWSESYAEIPDLNMTSLQRKIVLNLLLVSIAALPRGGDIELIINDVAMEVVAKGASTKFTDVEVDFLQGAKTIHDIDPRTVQIYYTYALIKAYGKDFALTSSDTEVRFRLAI